MPEPWLDRGLALGVPNTGASGMVHLLDRGGAEMERGRRAKETALLAGESELHSISLLWQAPLVWVPHQCMGVQKNEVFPVFKKMYILVQEMGSGQDLKKQNKQVGEISLQRPPRPHPTLSITPAICWTITRIISWA